VSGDEDSIGLDRKPGRAAASGVHVRHWKEVQ